MGGSAGGVKVGVDLSAHHWVNELDSIVLGRIVAGGDHDSDGLAIELTRSEGCEKTGAKDDRVKELAVRYEYPSRDRRDRTNVRLHAEL